jgi:hypothetical protein
VSCNSDERCSFDDATHHTKSAAGIETTAPEMGVGTREFYRPAALRGADVHDGQVPMPGKSFGESARRHQA